MELKPTLSASLSLIAWMAMPVSACADDQFWDALTSCREAKDPECAFFALADIVESDRYAEICKSDQPTHKIECYTAGVWLTCGALMASERISFVERMQIASRGRSAMRAHARKIGLEVTDEINAYMDSPWVLIEAEACMDGGGPCDPQVNVLFKESLLAGAFKKDVYRQCSRGAEAAFQRRLEKVSISAGVH